MLEVSREDVRTDIVESFDDPFIKLPIEKYMAKLGLEPISSQKAIINALNNPEYRFVTAAISRRQGKTYIANIIGQLIALISNSSVLIMSPNYSLSNVSFELQRSFIKAFGLPVLKDNAKDKVIELVNGSQIRMGSVNQVDACIGRSYKFIIFDEAALTEGMEAFNQSLRPTLDTEGSKALFISTPRGKNNWFAVLYGRGHSSADEYSKWVSIKATWKENPRAILSDIEEAKATMSDAYFRQEYLADFSVFEGQIWDFKDEYIVGTVPDTSRMEVFAGLDVGFRDPTAMVVVAYDREEGMFWLVDEYFMAAQSTEAHARNIQTLIDKWGIDFIYADSAAAQTRFDLAEKYDINTMKANKSVKDGVSHVAALVDRERVRVYNSCEEIRYAFDQYQWDPNPNLINEKPLHNRASHMADAIRYALYSFMEGTPGIF